MLNLWYKNAVIYSLDADRFMDSSGSGVGDFGGLANRLDHLEDLGVTCIWLMPFSPSPDRDNGYDIVDFYSVDPRLGSLGDFVDFTLAAKDRGMRVIMDLVGNHTSVDHPWFQSARSDPDSPYRDWYVWSDDKPENLREGMVFPGDQEATWTYDEEAGAWYMHRFYHHQPDLDVTNPDVCAELERIMGFWLQLGISGFRVDAVPFLIEYRGIDSKPERPPHALLTDMRRFLSWRKAEAILLGEANIPLEDALGYFGDGDRIHLIFNFIVNQHLFLALARRSAEPVRRTLAAMPPLPPTAQWANFLRNHDELDLGRLTESERAEVFEAFGPEPDMQLYGRGLRRRLAPMLGGDLRRLAMAYSLMFSLPGTPVLYYGEEIGMGEDLSLPGRTAVRTPMQWDEGRNGGFSSAAGEELVVPMASGGAYGYERANAESQRDAPGSLMDRIQRLVRTRRACPEVGWGEWTIVGGAPDEMLALAFEWQGRRLVSVHNFSDRDVEAQLDLGGDSLTLKPLLSSDDDRAPRPAGRPIRLKGYGYAWFRLHEPR